MRVRGISAVYHNLRRRTLQRYPRFGLASFAVIFAAIGTILLFAAHAATGSAAFTLSPQSGTISGNAQTVSDTSAIGGQAVEFGTGSDTGGGSTGGGGTTGSTDPSGADPLTTLSGYTLKYTQEFTGSSLPANWGAESGIPGGEMASQGTWTPSECKVSGGELHFMASGVDGCGVTFYSDYQQYGAYFVRMKGDIEPPGHYSDIALLWPSSNDWNAEVDFYEDMCPTTGTCNRSTYNASVCGSVANPASNPAGCGDQSNWTSQKALKNDGTQWHTYGTEWTPSGTSFLVDGKVTATSPKVPNVSMMLAMQSQDLDGTPVSANHETMTVDWVSMFSHN
ncbi:MAG TPA: glycoside hydrolase family 16 protein [Candidatus Saccharimonadales bacterium]|jgi:hypothetical protein